MRSQRQHKTDHRRFPRKRVIKARAHEPHRHHACRSGGGGSGEQGKLLHAPHPTSGRQQQQQQCGNGIEMRSQVGVAGEVEGKCDRQQKARQLSQTLALGLPWIIVIGGPQPARQGKEHAEDSQDAQPKDGSLRPHAHEDPGRLVEHRPRKREHHQPGPASAARQREETEVQQQNVGEQPDRIVAARREQDRRGKAAHQPQHRGDARTVSPRQQAARHRDQDHQPVGEACCDQLIENARRPGRYVEHHDTATGEGVSRGGVVALAERLRGSDRRQADDHPNRDANNRRNQIVLDGVPQEHHRRQRENDRAEHGRSANADPLFPIDPAAGGRRLQRRVPTRRHRWRWSDRRRLPCRSLGRLVRLGCDGRLRFDRRCWRRDGCSRSRGEGWRRRRLGFVRGCFFCRGLSSRALYRCLLVELLFKSGDAPQQRRPCRLKLNIESGGAFFVGSRPFLRPLRSEVHRSERTHNQ